MIDIPETMERLRDHVEELTITIGERSVARPENLQQAADYIVGFYEKIEVPVTRENYQYRNIEVANIVSEIGPSLDTGKRYILGAHYDSVKGTVGADDNASAVAVQLEVVRHLCKLFEKGALDVAVTCVSFALEEPPVYGTRYMGSRIYAAAAKKRKEKIDGMICLEMVGYTCRTPNCQDYPFPLMFFGYPNTGTFIGIVGNLSSRKLTAELFQAFQTNQELPVIRLTVPLGGWPMPAVRLSDHSSFWDKGFKAVMITDSAFYRNPYYHTSHDTMDKLDFRFMAELVESLVIFFQGAN